MSDIRWWHRIQLPDGTYTPGVVHHGPDGGDWPTNRFGLPENMSGMKVLDVGAWDGFFSFEAEKRGANIIVATDVHTDTYTAELGNWGGTAGFNEARRLLDSKVTWRKLDIINDEDTNKIIEEFGQFDFVMCFGVLYHIEFPNQIDMALANLKRLGKTIVIETAGSSDRTDNPVIEHKPGCIGDPTNFYYPNPAYINKILGNGEIIFDMDHRFTIKY